MTRFVVAELRLEHFHIGLFKDCTVLNLNKAKIHTVLYMKYCQLAWSGPCLFMYLLCLVQDIVWVVLSGGSLAGMLSLIW